MGMAVPLVALLLCLSQPAAAETTHTYPVSLTISVDRAADKISGTIVTDAPSEFCEISTIRIRRVMPGKDKVVAGLTPDCLRRAGELYALICDRTVEVSSTETAELTKLFENVFRTVNIALVNELAQVCDRLDIDVWEVVDAAATKPFGFMKFTPGPGLGGHCIPLDPHYLSWKMRTLEFRTRLIELASEINAEMPRFVLRKIADALNERGKPLKGSRVLLLGVSYKRDIDDMRESPSLDVMHMLQQRGADISYVDPYVPKLDPSHGGFDLTSIDRLDARTLRSFDCVAILTDHRLFDYTAIVEHSDLVVDTRNAIKERAAHVFRLGAPAFREAPALEAV